MEIYFALGVSLAILKLNKERDEILEAVERFPSTVRHSVAHLITGIMLFIYTLFWPAFIGDLWNG